MSSHRHQHVGVYPNLWSHSLGGGGFIQACNQLVVDMWMFANIFQWVVPNCGGNVDPNMSSHGHQHFGVDPNLGFHGWGGGGGSFKLAMNYKLVCACLPIHSNE